MLVLCLAAAGLSVFGMAAGQDFCSEPVAPYCVDTDSEFETQLQINRCEDDLMNYEQQLDEYEQCIADQIQAMRRDLTNAREKLEETK